VITTDICAAGEREVLGVDVGDSEDEVFWHRLSYATDCIRKATTKQTPRPGCTAAGPRTVDASAEDGSPRPIHVRSDLR